MPGETPEKRTILANPSEPLAGDNAYSFYDKVHPIHGQGREEMGRMRKALRGLRNKEVTVSFIGRHRESPDKRWIGWRRTVSLTLRSYSDLFGAGSEYAAALKSVREKNSDHKIIVDKIVITVH